ncbi:hypothetical protein EXIGLDRAFT_697457 [Exidia glandulosa HHB12029]|uniref:Uncharacterized protein n=1 Tax=Exidia glandulosa HHB12029 TaxID=1314781 RepID=A0A166A0U8_EXIGL|nr:hypothetical protein EXIGLDRAFT_697457 [Exidia glandulosa HHB12029]
MGRPFFLIALLVLCLVIAVQASPVLDSRGNKGKAPAAPKHAQPDPSKTGSSSSRKPKPATFPTNVKACAAHDSCNDCVESKNSYEHEGKTVVAKCIWSRGGERGKYQNSEMADHFPLSGSNFRNSIPLENS